MEVVARARQKRAREALGGKEVHPVDGRVSWRLNRQPAHASRRHRMQRKTILNWLEKHTSFLYGRMTLTRAGGSPGC